jgi:hypothetical protein
MRSCREGRGEIPLSIAVWMLAVCVVAGAPATVLVELLGGATSIPRVLIWVAALVGGYLVAMGAAFVPGVVAFLHDSLARHRGDFGVVELEAALWIGGGIAATTAAAPFVADGLDVPEFVAATLVCLMLVCVAIAPLAGGSVDVTFIRTFRHRRDEQGSTTGMVVVLGLALMLVAGLVIDGGYTLGARREAMNQAEQAARAGSDALSEGSLRDGTVRVDPARAAAAATAYLAQIGAHGRVSVNGDEVTVTVTSRQDTVILSIVGIGSLPVEATATSVSIDKDD